MDYRKDVTGQFFMLTREEFNQLVDKINELELEIKELVKELDWESED